MLRWLSTAVFGCLLLTSCAAPDAEDAPSTGRSRRGETPPPSAPGADLVLITLDTLRADVCGFLGGPAGVTPVLDRLAAAGRVYDNAHAHNVVTLPSHANILTGLYPFQHGVRDNGGFVLPRDLPTLATLLRGEGYATAAFVGAFPLDSRFGLDRGFEVYDDRYPRSARRTDFLLNERPGDEVVAAALDWWGSAGRPRFLWIHLFDPHAPYRPPEPYAERFPGDPYLGEVAATDAYLDPLLAPFLDGGEQAALVVVTADHGEALGDHGEPTHGLFAYEATLRVPLVIWGPGIEAGRDSRVAGHVDVLPTVLATLGLADRLPADLPGRSLFAPPAAERSLYFEALSSTLQQGWAPLRGVLRGRDKLIRLPIAELYDLAQDPGETANRFTAEPELARELAAELPAASAWPGRDRPPSAAARAEIAGDEQARLRSLGYVGGSALPKDDYGPHDDPKNLVDLHRKLHQVVEHYTARQLDLALPLAREVVAERPSMATGHALLAQVLLERGELGAAIATMEQARGLGAADEGLNRQLALSLTEAGRGDEAVAVLAPRVRQAGEHADPATLTAYAVALSAVGRQAEARDALERSFGRDPDDPKTLESLGMVALRDERWSDAETWLRRALDVHAGSAEAWNMLAVARYSGAGDGEGALEAWQRSLELDAEQWDVLYNLGTVAPGLGRPDLARQALERFVAGAPEDRYARDLARARQMLRRLGG